MRTDWLVSEDKIKYCAYGIDILKGCELLKTIKDISLNENDVNELINKCNRLKLSEIHIDDVIEDFLSQ